MHRFFELATGQRAFTGISDADILLSICRRLNTGPPAQFTICPPANQWAAHPGRFEMVMAAMVPGSPPLEPLVRTAQECLAWSPGARPTAEAVAGALRSTKGWVFPATDVGPAHVLSEASDRQPSSQNGQPSSQEDLLKMPLCSTTKSPFDITGDDIGDPPAAKTTHQHLDALHATCGIRDAVMVFGPAIQGPPSRIRLRQKTSNAAATLTVVDTQHDVQPPSSAMQGAAQPPGSAAASQGTDHQMQGKSVSSAICQCVTGSNCRSVGHKRGKACPNNTASGSPMCEGCRCKYAACHSSQRGGSGYCGRHMFNALPWSLQLVRQLSKLGMLEALEPVDVSMLFTLRDKLVKAVGSFDPVLEFIASWAQDKTFIHCLSDKPPQPTATPLQLQIHLHRTIKQMSNNHNAEAARCTHKSRGTGFSSCMHWLGIARTTTGRADKMKGNLRFVPFQPPRFITNVGATSNQVELGQSLVGITALVNGLRKVQQISTNKRKAEDTDMSEQACNARCLQRLTAISEDALPIIMNYVGPHIRLKHLLLHAEHNWMSLSDLKALELPDERKLLASLPLGCAASGKLCSMTGCREILVPVYHSHGLKSVYTGRQHSTTPTKTVFCKNSLLFHACAIRCTLRNGQRSGEETSKFVGPG